jgi:uncharacterized protein
VSAGAPLPGHRVRTSPGALDGAPDGEGGGPEQNADVSQPATHELNVLSEPLEPCGSDPVTGFYRDGCCASGPEDVGSHTVCAVVTAEFLAFQQEVGNDLSTPVPMYQFPGLVPGDRWCVVAARWLQAYQAGVAAPVVLRSTNARALEVVPLTALQEHAVDVPADPGTLS